MLDKQYADQCAKVADVVSWYNEKFSANIFLKAYERGLQNKAKSGSSSSDLISYSQPQSSTLNSNSESKAGQIIDASQYFYTCSNF